MMNSISITTQHTKNKGEKKGSDDIQRVNCWEFLNIIIPQILRSGTHNKSLVR